MENKIVSLYNRSKYMQVTIDNKVSRFIHPKKIKPGLWMKS